MTVASGRRPDAGALVPQQQGDGLELRTHGRRHAAAPSSRLDLTDSSGEHRDDVAAVVDASLLPRARARVEPQSPPLECRGTVATAACRTVPRPGRGTSRAEGLVLRTPSRLADLQGSTQRTSASVSHGPGDAGGWAGNHGTGESRRRTTGSVLGYRYVNACEGA